MFGLNSGYYGCVCPVETDANGECCWEGLNTDGTCACAN